MLSTTIVGDRNPIIYIMDGSNVFKKILVIGDPHLGRVFKTGVPKDKLGLRQQNVYSDFEQKMNTKDVDYIVVVGDLFDKANMSNECLLNTIDIVSRACINNPNKKYYIIAGNHDLTKDRSRKSTFDVFNTHMWELKLSNLSITYSGNQLEVIPCGLENIILLFVPYDPFNSDTFVDTLISNKNKIISFGHWEVEDFNAISGESKFIERMIPEWIIENSELIITGHEHKPKTIYLKDSKNNNKKVVVSGSMQPYAHNEQLSTESHIYTTVDVETLNDKLILDPDYYQNTNVRVLCSNKDSIPPFFNCLSKVYQTVIAKDEKLISKSTEIESLEELDDIPVLSFHTLFIEKLDVLLTNSDLNQTVLKNIESAFLNKTYNEED